MVNPKEVLALYSRPTKFEQENGIEAGPWDFFADLYDIKIYTRKTGDGSTTMLLIFRNGKTNHWHGWMPNERQFAALCNHIPPIILGIEQMNQDLYMA